MLPNDILRLKGKTFNYARWTSNKVIESSVFITPFFLTFAFASHSPQLYWEPKYAVIFLLSSKSTIYEFLPLLLFSSQLCKSCRWRLWEKSVNFFLSNIHNNMSVSISFDICSLNVVLFPHNFWIAFCCSFLRTINSWVAYTWTGLTQLY